MYCCSCAIHLEFRSTGGHSINRFTVWSSKDSNKPTTIFVFRQKMYARPTAVTGFPPSFCFMWALKTLNRRWYICHENNGVRHSHAFDRRYAYQGMIYFWRSCAGATFGLRLPLLRNRHWKACAFRGLQTFFSAWGQNLARSFFARLQKKLRRLLTFPGGQKGFRAVNRTLSSGFWANVHIFIPSFGFCWPLGSRRPAAALRGVRQGANTPTARVARNMPAARGALRATYAATLMAILLYST